MSCLLTVGLANAKLTVAKESDGTVVFTLEASGDIANEFTPVSGEWAKYTPSSLVQPCLNTLKLKVVTKGGVTMTSDDLKRICGMADEENNFPQLQTLDLENAAIANDNELTNLKFMDHLKTVTFPRTTTTIPAYCLANGSCQIENVVIPNNSGRSVTIGAQAFGSALKTVKLGEVDPNGNSEIRQHAFMGCTALTSVDFYFGWKTIGQQAFFDCSALKYVTLPEGLETIKNGAFSGCAIEAIHLPNTLKKIEATAFRCHYLQSITIPASVEEIESQAFQENYALKDVYVLGENTKAGTQAFDENAVSNFQYSNPTHITPVTRDCYKRGDGKSFLALLHFPESARSKYVNPSSSGLGGDTENVAAEDGNIWPTKENGKYTVTTGDYAGWKNFAITTKIKDDETWVDETRVDDVWYSMCLPFDLTEAQLKSAYGSTVEVVEFSGATITSKGGTNYLTLAFKTPVTETKAHHPYMIRPALHAGSATGMKVTIIGVNKQPENESSLENVTLTTTDGISYKFIGNYAQGKAMPANSYFYYNGKGATNGSFDSGFYKRTKEGGTWGKYTALVLASATDGVKAKAFTNFFTSSIDHETTGINNITSEGAGTKRLGGKMADKVINLNGQVMRNGSSLEGLPKGIYIVNGKKFVVR